MVRHIGALAILSSLTACSMFEDTPTAEAQANGKTAPPEAPPAGTPGADPAPADGDPSPAASGGAAAASGGAAAAGSGSFSRNLLPAADRARVLDAAHVTTTWENVTYQEGAAVFEGDALDAVLEHDHKSGRFVFDEAALSRAALSVEQGTPFMIPGLALRKVKSMKVAGGRVTVETEPAVMTDVIRDGTVGWKATLPFDRKHVLGLRIPDPLGPGESVEGRVLMAMPRTSSTWSSRVPEILGPPPVDPNAPQTTGSDLKWIYSNAGLQYDVELRPKSTSADFLVRVTKQSGQSGGVQYWAKGNLKQVMVNAKGEYREGNLKTLEYSQPDMVGTVELGIAAAGAGGNEINFVLPEAVLKYVFMAGPVPVVVNISAKMIGRVQVPSKGSAQAKANFSYSGQAGIKYDGTDVSVEGVFHKMDIKPNPFDSASMIGSKVDAQWGIGIPRVSVAAWGTFFIPYVQPGAVIGSSLIWGPLCKSGYVKFNGIVGYDFEVMGVKMHEKKHKWFEKEQVVPEGGCPRKK